jgi:putative MATE family efflux protein
MENKINNLSKEDFTVNQTNNQSSSEESRLNQDFSGYSLMKFTLPTIFLMMFSSLYNWVDGYFISNFVSEQAFAAANLTFPWISAILAVGLMIGSGGSAIIAKQLGEKKEHIANNTLSILAVFAVILGILFTVFGTIYLEDILNGLGVTDLLYEDAHIYLKTTMFFSIPLLLQLISQMFFVADGKPELGFKVGFIGGAVNIVLDYLFIIQLDLGIVGAILATGLGATIPALIFVVYFGRKNKQGLKFIFPKFEFNIIKNTCLNGSSEMISGLSTTVTALVLNLTILNIVGESGIVASGVISTAQYLLQSAFLGFSQGVSPIFSYNFGANQTNRLKKLLKLSLIINVIVGVLIFFSTLKLSRFIASVFIDPQSNAFEIAESGLNLLAIAFLFQGVNIFASALFTSLSNGKISALISFSRTFFFYLVFLLILPRFMAVDGIWLAIPFAEASSIIVSILCILKLKKKYKY